MNISENFEQGIQTERNVRDFYNQKGWNLNSRGDSLDAQLWEDLRPCAAKYVTECRRKITPYLLKKGKYILDAASGPIQYPEYLEYSASFEKRVCVDISENALNQAQEKLGDRGEYHRESILTLPFPDNYFDAAISLHTIYHIDKDHQSQAVRQLIRVTKPNSPIIVVYANPNRFFLKMKSWLRLGSRIASPSPIYYYAHPLNWWNQFSDQCQITLKPWRSLTAQDSRRLIPNNQLGSWILKVVLFLENRFPRWMTRLGAYPMIILEKNSTS